MRRTFIFVLVPFLAAFQDPPAKEDLQAEVKALRAEYQKAEQEYYRLTRAAKSAEERKQIVNPALDYLAKFQGLAERAKGTESGASALFEVFQLGQRAPKKVDESRKALETLVSDHIESPQMERVASSLRYAGYSIGEPSCRSALETIRDKSPLPKAKAAAIFILAIQAMPKDEAASRTAFIRLQKEFGDTTYASKANGFLFELDNLQIGKTAPDFNATDEKGENFKLSDFRGKVTVIDFWGFW
jgi:hypothetical protein